MVFEDSNADLAAWLFRARRHTMRLTARRVSTIVARVRLIAVMLAVVSPLWALVDFWAFEHEIADNLALIRTLCAVAFAAVVVMTQGAHTLRDAYRALFFLFAVSASFYLFASLYILRLDAGVVLDGFAASFGYLPFVMLAGLALFPLTVVESASLAIFVIAVHFIGVGRLFCRRGLAAFPGTVLGVNAGWLDRHARRAFATRVLDCRGAGGIARQPDWRLFAQSGRGTP